MPDAHAERDQRLHPFAEQLGVLGLYVFALFAFLGNDVSNAGLVLMLMAAIVQWREFGPALRRAPLVLVTLLALVSVALSVGFAVLRDPAGAGDELIGFVHFMQLWLFLLPAWWMAGKTSRTVLALTLALVGFTIGTLKALDPDELELLLNFRRPHFRWSINAIGQYSAAGLIGSVLLWPRFWRWSAGRWWTWWVRAVVFIFMVLLLAGSGLSLSRGVWASSFIVAGALVVLAWLLDDRKAPAHLSLWALVGVGILLVLFLAPGNPVQKRLTFIVEPFKQFVASGGDLAAIRDDSFVARFRILAIGIESWRQSPVIGLGPAAPERIMMARRGEFAEGENFTDLHSLPMDLLVSFGVLGLLAMLVGFIAMLRCAWLGYRSGCLPRDIFLLAAGLTVFNLLCQMTDTRLFSSHGRFFWILISGAACSCWLRGRKGFPDA